MSKTVCKSLLIDTNVWLDYLLDSQPNSAKIGSLFDACARKGVTLLYTPTTLKDVFYIVPRRLKNSSGAKQGESYQDVAWDAVEFITAHAVTARQALPECHMAWALRGEHPDLEDNLVFAAAETSGADYVVTNDQALLGHLGPACITPEQALTALRVGDAGVRT